MAFHSKELRGSYENSIESRQSWKEDGVSEIKMTGLENTMVVVEEGEEIIKFYP